MYKNDDEKFKGRFRTVEGYPFCGKSPLWENTQGWYEEEYKNKPLLQKILLSPVLAVKFLFSYSILYRKSLYKLFRGKDYDRL